MLVQKLSACEEFTTGNSTILQELLHPDKQPLKLRYSLAHVIVQIGHATTPHSLKNSEVFHILTGHGEMHIDGELQIVEPGDTVYIPPHAKQFIRNCGDQPLVFICIVDPAWRKEDVNIY